MTVTDDGGDDDDDDDDNDDCSNPGENKDYNNYKR